MAEERELKFATVDHTLLRRRLAERGAELHAALAAEGNWIFDRGGELASRGCLLRLRRDAHGVRLTYKGKARFEDGVKVRRELETALDSLDDMRATLAAIGFDLVRRYEKRREEWLDGGNVIALDETPLGDFAEFEGPDAIDLARFCGLDPQQAERRSYLELWADHARENPDVGPDMVFS